MPDILLDREGDAALPDGYQYVTSEVEFLLWADQTRPLMIRGEGLCNWAEAFYQARGIAYRETRSIKNEIRAVCPGLTDDHIQALVHQLGGKLQALNRPLTAQGLLQTLYPAAFWKAPLSLRHAANWLLWVYEENPADYVQPLLRQIGELWRMEANHSALESYRACVCQQAQQMLVDWLGIGDRSASPIVDEFPIEVPEAFQEKARLTWSKQIIESRGAFFDQIEKLRIPFALKKQAAKETCRYFINHPDELTLIRLDQLSVYLTQNELNQLHQRLAPPDPGELPDEPVEVLNWFRNDYLPYREWQHYVNAPKGKEKVLQAARKFATWYLDRYPKALAGAPLHNWINFNKVNQLSCGENCLILLVVLDGLHVTDARFLLQSIRSHTQRLSLVSEDLAFTSLPTITQFAKEALFRGVPPVKVLDVEPIGEILPEDKSPATRLAKVQNKGIYLWRVLEPDRTYHQKNKSENLRQDVEGRLEAESLKIKEIVETIPDNIVMQIIVTTDHGRMLGQAVRTIPVPDGMQGHGRAAWGKIAKIYPEAGYVIEDPLVYLFAESFGLPEDVVIILDESAFRGNDNRAGSEIYPHGGMFPEEIIVPWIVLARDYVRPEVEITISGRSTARRSGALQIHVLNKSDIDLTLKDVVISFRHGSEKKLDVEVFIGACSEKTHSIELDTWPSPSDVKYISAVVRLGQPNQLVFDYPAQMEIQSDDMYVEPDNPLEDFNLNGYSTPFERRRE